MKAPAFGVDSRDYWACQLSGWGGLAVLSVLSSASGNSLRGFIAFAIAKSLCMVTGLACSHLWRAYLKRRGWLHGNGLFPFGPICRGLALMAIVQTGILFIFDAIFLHGSLRERPDEVVLLATLLFGLWFSIFAVWTLWYVMVLSRRRATHAELEKLELELSMKDAELRALQAQVNPHFFFNSLNSIRALVYQDADAAANAIGQLAGMMRYSLRTGATDTVPLADEITAIQAYLAMEKLRFEERLQLEMVIAPGMDQVLVPPMALQTLVENAIKHGVETSAGACRLRVAASRGDGQVTLSVANEGQLAATSQSTRLGLANTGKRLALLFGPAASCTLAVDGGWVLATIVFPEHEA